MKLRELAKDGLAIAVLATFGATIILPLFMAAIWVFATVVFGLLAHIALLGFVITICLLAAWAFDRINKKEEKWNSTSEDTTPPPNS